MNSISNMPSVALPTLPPHLAAAGSSGAQGTTKEMAQEFESLMLSQILKQMRSTEEEGGGLFPGDKSDTYGGMFDMYFGKYLAEKGGLGLTDFIARQTSDM